MKRNDSRSGLARSILLLTLGILTLALLWIGTYFWVDRSSRDLLYRKDSPTTALARLEAWSPWMFSPNSWKWLRAEAHRKLGDRVRVNRLVDEMAASGLPSIQATSPLLLLDASAGVPGKVKENLGPLLILYKANGSEVLGSLVQGFLNQGDLVSASQTLRLWTELFESDPKASFWKGVHSTISYDLDGALQAFRNAIALDPEDVRAHQELSEVLIEKANFEEARKEYEWLISRKQESPEIITGYARSLLNLGYPDLAAEQLKKLKDVSKLRSPELALVCETNLEAGQVQEASDQAAILLKRWPDALPYLQLQARCLAKLGKGPESEKLFAQAAESQKQRPLVDQMIDKLSTDSSNQPLRRDMGELMMN